MIHFWRNFAVIAFTLSFSSQINAVNIEKALDWGIPSIDNLVELNGFALAHSQASGHFYLFENLHNNWELKEIINGERNLASSHTVNLKKIKSDTIAFVSPSGTYTTLRIEETGKPKISEWHLPGVEIPTGSSITLRGGPFNIVEDKLLVVGGYPRAVHVFSLSSNYENPSLIAKTELPPSFQSDLLFDVTATQNRVWIVGQENLGVFNTDVNNTKISHFKTIKAPQNEGFTSIEVVEENLIIGRQPPFVNRAEEGSGYFYIAIEDPSITLESNSLVGFEDLASEEAISRIKHIEDGVSLVTYPTKLVFTDLSDPLQPKILSGLEELSFHFGQSTFSNGKVYSPVGGLGFAVLQAENFVFNGLGRSFYGQSSSIRSITVVEDNIYLSRFSNAGMTRLSGEEINQLIAGEIDELDESFKYTGESPNCFVEDNQYVYGVRNLVWQIRKSDGQIINNGALIHGSSDGSINGEACLLIDGELFLSASDGHLWRVKLEDIQDIDRYTRYDFSEEFISSRGYIRNLISNGEKIFMSDGNHLLTLQQNNTGEWFVAENVDFFEVIKDIDEWYLSANIIDLDLFGDFLIVSENNSGRFFSFDIKGQNFELTGVTKASCCGLVSTAAINDFVITSGENSLRAFKHLGNGEFEETNRTSVGMGLWKLTPYEDLLFGIKPDNTLAVFRVENCADNNECEDGSNITDPSNEISALLFNDFDGDGISDIGVRRSSTQMWYVLNSSGNDIKSLHTDGISRLKFGLRKEDIPVSADYDGDGITDFAVRRPSTQTWYILNSGGIDLITGHEDGITRRRFGQSSEDIPVPADYDGDGKADLAVRRPSNQMWYILNSSGVDGISGHQDGITRMRFGSRIEDIPVPADYDGDGKADLAVRRPSTTYWYIRNSSGIDDLTNNADGVSRKQFGRKAEDVPVAGDFDGDGRSDIAVRRPSTHHWYIFNSSKTNYNSEREDGIQRIVFGRQAEDIPVTADYDGDGITDLAVRRPSNYHWYILNSSQTNYNSDREDGIQRIVFGRNSDDIPISTNIMQIMKMLESREMD